MNILATFLFGGDPTPIIIFILFIRYSITSWSLLWFWGSLLTASNASIRMVRKKLIRIKLKQILKKPNRRGPVILVAL